MDDLRKGKCSLCERDQVIEAEPLDLHGEWGERSTPMAVTYGRTKVEDGGLAITAIYGRLRLYVCRSCGAAQWFADSPELIPIGEEYRTQLVEGPKQAGPYR